MRDLLSVSGVSPQSHWRYIRTTDVLETPFRGLRRRTHMVGHLPNEMPTFGVIFGVLAEERLKRRRFTMNPVDIVWVENAMNPLGDQPISIELMEAVATQGVIKEVQRLVGNAYLYGTPLSKPPEGQDNQLPTTDWQPIGALQL